MAIVETYIIPERHDEDHSLLDGIVHLREAANFGEARCIVKCLDGSLAPLLGELVALNTGPGRVGVLDLLAVLDEELDDLALGPLGDNAILSRLAPGEPRACGSAEVALKQNLREHLGGVERLAGAVEVLVTLPIWVVIATVGVTVAVEAVFGVSTTAAVILANVVCVVLARMRGNGEGVSIGLCW